jgi:hypothetical protein
MRGRIRPPQGQLQFCGTLQKLDETLSLAESSGLKKADIASRAYLASRGMPDYLMTLVIAHCAACRRPLRSEFQDLMSDHPVQLRRSGRCDPAATRSYSGSVSYGSGSPIRE